MNPLFNENLQLLQTLPGLYLVRNWINDQISFMERTLGIVEAPVGRINKKAISREALIPVATEKKTGKNAWYHNLSPEKKKELSARARERRKERKLEAQKAIENKSKDRSERMKAFWANLSPEERAKKLKIVQANRMKAIKARKDVSK